jgi:hypothetical protein
MMYDVIRPDGRVFGRNPGQPDGSPYTYAVAIDIAANVGGTVVPSTLDKEADGEQD